MKPHDPKWRAEIGWLSGLAVVGTLATGTIRDPNFWWTSEQRGDQLLRAGRFKEAAEVYRDPFRIGVAQYRNGDFEAAAKTFVRVPGAIGAYDAANALLMHGKYEATIASYRHSPRFRLRRFDGLSIYRKDPEILIRVSVGNCAANASTRLPTSASGPAILSSRQSV
jgi:hypothetical protein